MGFTPTPAVVDPRVLSGIAALVFLALLLLLYFYRRRDYILFWAAGWGFVAASMFVTKPTYPATKLGFMVYGFAQFLGIVAALAFVISADAYRSKPRLHRSYGLILMPVLLWFALAPVALGPTAAFAPGHVLIAGALAAASAAHFALLRRARLLGAAVVGATLLGLAGVNVWLALSVPQPDAPAAGHTTFLTLGLYLVMALGMQLMTFEDMTYELRVTNRRLESAQSELRQLVTTDALTGCRNRRFFDEIIGREMERHRRYGIPLSLLFIDVDRFKVINDTMGHEAGDRVLQQVAAFLARSVREADYVFRWGGDEFLVLISCAEAEAERKGAELRASFAASKERSWLPEGVGLSIGTAQVPAAARDVMAVVKLADARMYADKRRSSMTNDQ
jgi:diguanylate cyclase (GGDEF)-like protein